MSERIVNIPVTSNPSDTCYVIPDGWHVKQILHETPGSPFFGPTVLAVLITDQKEDRLYNPDNVVYGPAHGHIDEAEDPPYPNAWGAPASEFQEPESLQITHPGGEFHPHYYQTESGLDPWEVIRQFNLDYWRGTMVAYLCRAGTKPGNSELDDLRKVYTFAAERIRELEAEELRSKQAEADRAKSEFYRRSDLPIVGVQFSSGSDVLDIERDDRREHH